jgi:hypothetical protein
VNSFSSGPVGRVSLVCTSALLLATFSQAQDAPATPVGSGPEAVSAMRDLQNQVRELRGLIEQMRAENAAEMQQLRQDLQATRALLERSVAETAKQPNTPRISSGTSQATAGEDSAATDAQTAVLDQRVQKLEDTTSLLGSKIDEQYQTKVETASKYRVRLHGIILMNAFRNLGGVNSLDLPDYAQTVSPGSPRASLGATLRQSELGFEVFGPNIVGAKTSGDVQFDFAGGFPATGNGVDFGIVRLQTADLRFDWQHTSIVAGQDALFISPLSPTSFASLATPTFGFAGNLWAWTPQFRVEHRFSISDQQTLSLQAGVLDNLDWEFPPDPFYRYSQSGESSGQPAYALRTAWSRSLHSHPLSFAVAGYYDRQNWSWNRYVDGWAGMADWQIPIVSRLSLSGEFYRGRGIGGLGAAVGRTVVFAGNPMQGAPPLHALDAAGGWSQIKFQITPKVEINGVIAEDDAFTRDIRGFATDADNFGPILGRNRGALTNVVFRPRSDLILSAELRRLRSFPVYSSSTFSNQLNLSMGILF